MRYFLKRDTHWLPPGCHYALWGFVTVFHWGWSMCLFWGWLNWITNPDCDAAKGCGARIWWSPNADPKHRYAIIFKKEKR